MQRVHAFSYLCADTHTELKSIWISKMMNWVCNMRQQEMRGYTCISLALLSRLPFVPRWFYIFKCYCPQCTHAYCSWIVKMSSELGTLALELFKKYKAIIFEGKVEVLIIRYLCLIFPPYFLIYFHFQFFNVFFFSVVYTSWRPFFSLVSFVCCLLTSQWET